MENSEISIHEVAVYTALKGSGKWLTNADIANTLVHPVAPRTVRLHTKRLVDLGLIDVAEVFPAHRYRISAKASKRNAAYLKRLEGACKVFEL